MPRMKPPETPANRLFFARMKRLGVSTRGVFVWRLFFLEKLYNECC